MATITWVGLGQMGKPMASNLVKAGHEVRGIEIDAAAAAEANALGIAIYDDVISAIPGSDFVCTMLPNGDLVSEALTGEGGIFELIDPGTVVIDCSTIAVSTARDIHDTATRRGIRFLDAPVSGGVEGAAAGTLTIMIGGDDVTFECAQSMLEAFGRFVVHMGGPGSGQATKIVNNMIFGICLAATCEGVALAEQLGLDTRTLYEVITRSSGDNWALRNWYPVSGVVESAPSSGGFAPGFTTQLLVKDLTLALRAGEESGNPLEAAHTAHRLLTDHMNCDAAYLDCTSLITSLRAVTRPEPELEVAG
ncbi:NAD(P)-dependent oxidoreductase [Rhodococcus koreensis]